MARWIPDDKARVAPNEHVGRRLFDEPKLSGAPDQQPFRGLLVKHFIEKRAGGEFSVDRLGRTGVDKGNVRYLQPRASAAGATFRTPKRFDGWIAGPVQKIATDPPGIDWPVASCVRTHAAGGEPEPWSDKNLQQNCYHAHVPMPPTLAPYDFALRIREQFLTHGTVYPVSASDAPKLTFASAIVWMNVNIRKSAHALAAIWFRK